VKILLDAPVLKLEYIVSCNFVGMRRLLVTSMIDCQLEFHGWSILWTTFWNDVQSWFLSWEFTIVYCICIWMTINLPVMTAANGNL